MYEVLFNVQHYTFLYNHIANLTYLHHIPKSHYHHKYKFNALKKEKCHTSQNSIK